MKIGEMSNNTRSSGTEKYNHILQPKRTTPELTALKETKQ
jgi:hypothetical protein